MDYRPAGPNRDKSKNNNRKTTATSKDFKKDGCMDICLEASDMDIIPDNDAMLARVVLGYRKFAITDITGCHSPVFEMNTSRPRAPLDMKYRFILTPPVSSTLYPQLHSTFQHSNPRPL
jgi:hypothetical protein